MAARCEPLLVSIQRVAAADAVDGHLSWAVLLDRDRVAVPGPLHWLHDPAQRFEALLVSRRVSGRGVIERVAVQRADLIGVREHPGSAMAVLQLARAADHRSRYAGRFDPEVMHARLAEGADAWTVLEELGAVPSDVRTRPVAAALGPVVTWEQALRRELVRDRMWAIGDPHSNLCCWLGCGPCDPCPPDPWW